MATGAKKPGLTAGDEIARIARDAPPGSDKRASHLINLSMASLKYLMLNAESDDLRLQATKALLELPPVRRKLQHQQEMVKPSRPDKRTPVAARIQQALADPERAQRLLALLDQEGDQEGESAAESA